jgi:hypothetical protein
VRRELEKASREYQRPGEALPGALSGMQSERAESLLPVRLETLHRAGPYRRRRIEHAAKQFTLGVQKLQYTSGKAYGEGG